MATLNAQIIKKAGKKEYAVIPYEEFLKLQEALDDYEDLRCLRAAKAAERNAATIAQGQREAEPRWITSRCRLRQDQLFRTVGQTLTEPGKIALARDDEIIEAIHLCQGAGGLHVGDFQVVAQVSIGVFVIVALWQIAQLPTKSFAAGVVFSGRTVTVATPVPEALGDLAQFVVVRKDSPTFAHGDVMGRVKTEGSDVTKSAHQTPIVGGTQRIAAIFNQPQLILLANGLDHVQVVRVAQRMRQHDRLGFGADGRLQLRGIDVVGPQFDIDKNRAGAKLNDRVDRGGESSRHTDDFIPGFDGSIAQLG